MTNPVAEGPKKAATGVVIIDPAVAPADNGRCSGPVAAAAAAAEASSGREGSVTGGKIEVTDDTAAVEEIHIWINNYEGGIFFRIDTIFDRRSATASLITVFTLHSQRYLL